MSVNGRLSVAPSTWVDTPMETPIIAMNKNIVFFIWKTSFFWRAPSLAELRSPDNQLIIHIKGVAGNLLCLHSHRILFPVCHDGSLQGYHSFFGRDLNRLGLGRKTCVGLEGIPNTLNDSRVRDPFRAGAGAGSNSPARSHVPSLIGGRGGKGAAYPRGGRNTSGG